MPFNSPLASLALMGVFVFLVWHKILKSNFDLTKVCIYLTTGLKKIKQFKHNFQRTKTKHTPRSRRSWIQSNFKSIHIMYSVSTFLIICALYIRACSHFSNIFDPANNWATSMKTNVESSMRPIALMAIWNYNGVILGGMSTFTTKTGISIWYSWQVSISIIEKKSKRTLLDHVLKQ